MGSSRDQVTKDLWDFVELGGLVQEVVCAGCKAFCAIVGKRIIRANQYVERRVALTNRTQNFQTTASGHLEVENNGIGTLLHNRLNRFRGILGYSYELDTGYLLQQVGQTFDNSGGIIGNKDSHLFAPQGPPARI